MPEFEIPRTWWSGGVRFTCLGCGRCCRGDPGAIFFTAEEGERVRKHLGVEPEEFERRYVTGKWGRLSFVERPGGDCVFYDAETAKCAIYPIRPLQCSLFPFWPSVMESRAEWDREARWCPGMNDGSLHDREEIQFFLRQCPFDDL